MPQDSSPTITARSGTKGKLWLALLLVSLGVNVWLAKVWVESRAEGPAELFWALCQTEALEAERKRAFLALLETGHSEWRSARLQRLDLRGIDFTGKAMDGADLTGCNFSGTQLAGASLVNVELAVAELVGADLSRARLDGIHLFRSGLDQATLTDVSLRSAHLQEMSARGADFRGADLTDADLLMAKLTGSNLSMADFSGADLEAADLRGTELTGARFEAAKLKDTDFSDSNWWRARGFTTQSMERLKKEFTPGEAADSRLRADFERWRSETQR
jgi:uncharacterized protein YjbI with pentapeptide repeats